MMLGWHGRLGRLRFAIALVALGLVPVAASADSLLSEIYGTRLKFVWATPLVPAAAVPGYSGDAVPLVSMPEFANELFVSGIPEPGLQFALDPVEEEVFLGWRFRF